MAKKYKRKFKVPGNTIRTCWDFRRKCEKQFGFHDPITGHGPPCYKKVPTTRRTYTGLNFVYERDESLCPFPVNRPKEYIVSETEDGEWECSCPAWKFRRIQCHHIRRAQADPERYEIAKEFTEKLTKTFDKVFEHLGDD